VKDYDPTGQKKRRTKETKDQIRRPRLSGETEEESRDVGRRIKSRQKVTSLWNLTF
jgi:hypothetical protein